MGCDRLPQRARPLLAARGPAAANAQRPGSRWPRRGRPSLALPALRGSRCVRLFWDLEGLRCRLLDVLVVTVYDSLSAGGLPENRPEQRMPIQGTSFDEQVESFVSHVLNPSGFEVERWTRLPYLCEGDLRQAYYWLSDAVFVLKKNASS